MTAALTDRQRQVIETAERVGSRKKAAALLGMTEGALRGALSAGERCRVCWLLLPCHGHGSF